MPALKSKSSKFPTPLRMIQDIGGATAVEFALVSPLVCLLIMMIFEMGMTVLMQNMLDNATFDAARIIKTGSAQSSGSSATFLAKICADTSFLFDCSNIRFNVQSGSTFSALSPTVTTDANGAMTNTVYAPGASSSDVLVQVAYTRTLFAPLITPFLGTKGKILLLSSLAFQNEPF